MENNKAIIRSDTPNDGLEFNQFTEEELEAFRQNLKKTIRTQNLKTEWF